MHWKLNKKSSCRPPRQNQGHRLPVTRWTVLAELGQFIGHYIRPVVWPGFWVVIWHFHSNFLAYSCWIVVSKFLNYMLQLTRGFQLCCCTLIWFWTHEKLEGTQRVHMSAKWIFLQLLYRLGGRWCPVKTESLSWAIFEITGLKDIGMTTLTCHGDVTSSMTSSFDPL